MYKRLLPASGAAQMKEINDFVLKIFEYFSLNEDFDANDFFAFLGPMGVWFQECYQKRPKLARLLGELAEMPLLEKGALYRAMRADADFASQAEDPDFEFQVSSLSGKGPEKAAALCVYLYDSLFVPRGFRTSGGHFTYEELKEQLCAANNRFLCPACLIRGDSLKELGQLDHFFPKRKYPALTFHPRNLVLICGNCNGAVTKGTSDPMEDTNLTELYLPYLRGAEGEMEILVQHDDDLGHKVELRPLGNGPETANRIANDDRLFHLKDRWNERVSGYIEDGIDEAVDFDTRAEVESYLQENALKKRRAAAKHEYELVEAACYEYLLFAGKKAFVAAWERTKRDHEKMLQ